jgi:DHA1 family bicyclomycin/chloramphenicol resistance-like MFS transporter
VSQTDNQNNSAGEQQIIKQRLGRPGLITLITLLQLTMVFATDMYMPAMPMMAEYFDVSASMVQMTLFVFFLCSPVGFLIFGSLSDKYGRKPILYAGSVVYVATSLICAFAPTIWVMLPARVFQAVASAAMSTIAMALARDCFSGKIREEVLMVVQASFIVGPIIAPVIGGQIMLFASWRVIFIILAGFGVVCALLVFALRETVPPALRNPEPALKSLGRLGVVLKQKRFVVFLIVINTFSCLPFMAYLSGSPYIYEIGFGMSPQEFSLYLGAACGISVVGLLIYRFCKKLITLRALTTTLIVTAGISGVGTILIGGLSPIYFFVLMTIFQTTSIMIRPYGTNILLEIQTSDVGSASAIMNFTYNIMGCIGMIAAMVIGGNYILAIGGLMVIGALVSIGAWIYFLRSPMSLPGIK